MVFPRFCAHFLFALGSLGALAAAEEKSVTRDAAPRWIIREPVDFAASDEAVKQQGEGSHLLLRDAQRHLEEATEYRHIALRLLTPAGVQSNSTLTFEFDPGYERLVFHELVIHRDGAHIDRLKSSVYPGAPPPQEIQIFRRETRLEHQLYDGRLTASMILDDVRVGDVIEYSYSRIGVNPIYAGHLLGSISTERTRPIHQARERLLCSTRRSQPRFQEHGSAAQAKVQQWPGDLMEYRWDANDRPGRIQEGDVPSWVDTLGWVQYSDFQDWNEVARWAAALFAPAVPAPRAPLPEELEKEAAALEALPEGAARIAAALRYVQDNFRYLGNEIGANTHQPYPVEKVCARRFGDCKDKANLLSVLLRRLGYRADPALVSTDYRHTIRDWIPSPMIFDHAIVRVYWNGRAYWLDPTRGHQGGTLDHIYLPTYGKALIVHPSTQDLDDVAAGGQEESTIEVLNTYRQTSYQEPATLHVRTTYHGAEADYLRETRAITSAEELQRDYLNYYVGRYARAEVRQPVRFSDDLERNELVSEEEYTIPEIWEPSSNRPGKLELSFYAGALSGRLTRPATLRRTLPFGVRVPSHIKEQFDIQLPEDRPVQPEHVETNDPAFFFVFDKSLGEKGALRLQYEYQALTAEVPAARTAEYFASVKRARDVLDNTIYRAAAAAPVISANPAFEAGLTAGRAARRLVILVVAVGLLSLFCLAVVALWRHQRARRDLERRRRERAPGPVLHSCAVCHRTDVSHPDLEFRVAGDGQDYCVEHLQRPATSAAG